MVLYSCIISYAEMVYSIMLPLMTLTLLSVYCFMCLIWFYAYKCYICLPMFAHGLSEWLMILTLFAQLTHMLMYYIG